MKSYYRREVDKDFGNGVVYLEFDGERATRQVESYGEVWFCSASEADYIPELGPGLADQPPSDLGLTADDAISPEDFEAAWSEAIRRTRAAEASG